MDVSPRKKNGTRKPAREDIDVLRSGQALLSYFGLSGDFDEQALRENAQADLAIIIIRNRILDL